MGHEKWQESSQRNRIKKERKKKLSIKKKKPSPKQKPQHVKKNTNIFINVIF